MENKENSKQAIIAWLENRHKEVMACEGEALTALDAGDVEAYRKAMKRKAESLAAMEADCEPLLASLPSDFRQGVAGALRNFSSSARTALSLGSIFYMSALLYPDTHKKGEPDNLELFIAGLKA